MLLPLIMRCLGRWDAVFAEALLSLCGAKGHAVRGTCCDELHECLKVYSVVGNAEDSCARERLGKCCYATHMNNSLVRSLAVCTSVCFPPSPLPPSISFPFLLARAPPPPSPSFRSPLSLGKGRGLDRGRGARGEGGEGGGRG